MNKIRHLTDTKVGPDNAKVAAGETRCRMTAIAIVEDDRTLRETLVELIENTPGFRCVCVCASSKEALAAVPRHQPDVVLMDIHLPGESGIECTAKLTAQMPKLQVIILTIYKDIRLIFQALKAGASGYVLKRSRPEEIVEAITEVRAGGAPMTGEIARMVVRSFKEPAVNRPATEALSAREMEILVLLAEGLSNKEIAGRISVSTGTVRTHVEHILQKLHVRCRGEAAARYFQSKSVTPALG